MKQKQATHHLLLIEIKYLLGTNEGGIRGIYCQDKISQSPPQAG